MDMDHSSSSYRALGTNRVRNLRLSNSLDCLAQSPLLSTQLFVKFEVNDGENTALSCGFVEFV